MNHVWLQENDMFTKPDTQACPQNVGLQMPDS